MRGPVVLLLALAASLHAAEQTVAYTDGTILTRALDGGKPRRITEGAWPDISPDGTKVAYNTESAKTMERRIAVADIATRRSTVFSEIPSDNCHSPAWSPDGKQITFYIYADSDWHIGLVNADGTGFRYVHKAGANHRTRWGAAWAADGKSLFCQDLDTLYRIALDGKILAQWSVEKTFPRGGLNSGARLAPSPDGKSLLVDVDMGEDVNREDWDGPPPSIWQLDLATGRADRITKPDQYLWEPAWINDREILCNGLPAGSKTFSIFRLPVAGGKPTLWVKKARSASVSNP